MFKKSPVDKQPDMFTSPAALMSERDAKVFNDPKAWHNQFYHNVTANIDEEVFRPLYTEGNANGKDGRPNAPIRMLVAMMILREGVGCNDEQFFENCRFNLLYRAAIGLVNLSDSLPSDAVYRNLRKAISRYEEETGKNLFDECFRHITTTRFIKYKVMGKTIRMDSKLLSSNIAWYTRYEEIITTFDNNVNKKLAMEIDEQLLRQQALDFLGEDTARTISRTNTKEMSTRLLKMGIIIDRILTLHPTGLEPLRRVFNEQYIKHKNGNVGVRDKKLVCADSAQEPNSSGASQKQRE